MEALIPGKDQGMPSPFKYPAEPPERATRMVFEARERTGERCRHRAAEQWQAEHAAFGQRELGDLTKSHGWAPR